MSWFLVASQESTKITGCLGSFWVSFSPPFFCATSKALSLSTLRNPMSNGSVELLLALQLSSAEKLIPCSGASGPTSPDHTNNFIIFFDGEANEARHIPDLPSAVGASGVNCDCRRKGFASGAHRRADKYMRWNAVRAVSYCASLTSSLGAGWEAVSVVTFFSDEHETSTDNARQSMAALSIILVLG